MPETTQDEIWGAFERVFGVPLDGPRERVHPDEWEAGERAGERAQDDAWWDGWASDREMDGAAADYVYGRGPALDWRRP